VAKSRRRPPTSASVSDLLVLNAQGVTKAAVGDRWVQAWLERARELDADIIVSSVTLAEVIRGVPRDAQINRVLKPANIWPADESLARQAGRLPGEALSDATIDAFVAATALLAREPHTAACCVVLTSEREDLRMLLADDTVIRAIPV
jgi:predicted nucleic acid-binding protein